MKRLFFFTLAVTFIALNLNSCTPESISDDMEINPVVTDKDLIEPTKPPKGNENDDSDD